MITDEEINQILLSSPMVLPNSPAEAGLKAGAVKELFYKYIRALAKVINIQLVALEQRAREDIIDHNEGATSHSDIRATACELESKIEESYNSIVALLNEHNDNFNSHSKLIGWVQKLERDIQDAYNLASGKSRIYPVNDVYEMLGMLGDYLNVGDKFVLATQGVPDFILFEKNSTRTDVPTLSSLDLMLGLTLEAGKFYICNGYLFVATECGIDTSLFARQEELNSVKNELLTKENAPTRVYQAQEQIELQPSTVHTLGLRTSLSLSVPSDIEDSFYSVVSFRSGTTPTTLASQGIIFVQDDAVNGELVPVSNRLYELYVRKVDSLVIATVFSTDYEVIE